MSDWETLIEEARESLEKKIADIEKNKEKYIEAWIAETGLHPSECVLIEKREMDGSTRFWLEKKGTNDRIEARL